MTTTPVRPVRGGFLRPFGCGTFIREFLLGRGPQGAPTIDPNEGAPQADIFYEYKQALLRATALDRATRTEERQAQREGRAISPEEIERLTEGILARLPYRTRYARYHSFLMYFTQLQRLGWVEPAGREETSAFQTNYPAGPPRRWYRLTTRGQRAGLVAWGNPKAALYPVAVLAPPTPPPAAPAVPERPRRRAAPPAPPPAPAAPPVALGPPETAPREIKEIWERSLAEVKRAYPIGHPSLKAEAERAGVSQEETQKIIAHGIYIERRRKVLERWAEEEAKAPPPTPPPAPAPARPPTEIPAFTVAPKPSRAAAQRLIAHLEKVKKVGLVWPEVQAELERLSGEVSGWAELVGEARDNEEGKEEPNEDRLDTLQDRFEALERAAEELEAGDVDDAIGTLDDAWPPPARAG